MQRVIAVPLVLFALLGCATNPAREISLPMPPHVLAELQEDARGRELTFKVSGSATLRGSEAALTPTGVSFLDHHGQRRTVTLAPGMSMEYSSAARGARLGFARGFWTLAAVSGVLFVETGGGEDDGEWLLPFMGVSGVVGGAIGALFGAANGGRVRFEFVEATAGGPGG